VQARAFIEYLAGPEATRIFREAGFIPQVGN
jgi:ABC-type molybdate transport system substrate-binding protein